MPETFDASARKFHQLVSVALLAAGYVVGPMGAWLVALVGVVFLLGRFWWPADIFRQLAWRALEPARILPRRDVVEDHATRRIARVLGGAGFLLAAVLVAIGQSVAGWIIVGGLAVMIFLDGAFDY
ncbi:MAG TPA: DUF4395 family protein [Chloroflexota bacterium]|jgi:hypothetical protein